MKVIAGQAKGRKLKFPKLPQGKSLRPLTGRVKEALFNILAARIQGVRFLDLFAGTGSVGIEALSRGAEIAIFVERDRKIAEILRANLEMTGFSDRSEVYCLDAVKSVKVLDGKGAKFDIIFVGAPYGSPDLIKVLEQISSSALLADDGVVVAEHHKRLMLPDAYAALKRQRDANYGDTVLTFYSIGAKQ